MAHQAVPSGGHCGHREERPYMDRISTIKRSALMKNVRSCNTAPERIISSLLRNSGYKFKKHVKILPGTPDFVMFDVKVAIFAQGCFWHQHKSCLRSKRPESNSTFWNEKLNKNILRDGRNKKALWKMGWHVLTIWECSLKNKEKILKRIQRFAK